MLVRIGTLLLVVVLCLRRLHRQRARAGRPLRLGVRRQPQRRRPLLLQVRLGCKLHRHVAAASMCGRLWRLTHDLWGLDSIHAAADRLTQAMLPVGYHQGDALL